MFRRVIHLLMGFVPAFLMCGVAILVIWLDVVALNMHCCEGGFVEWGQFASIMSVGIILAVAAKTFASYRGGIILAAGFYFAMAIREQDALLDCVFKDLWVVLVGLDLMVAFYFAAKFRDTILPGLEKIRSSRYFSTLALSLVLIIVFSRTFGYKGIWRALGNYDHLHIAKRVAEESIELLGYILSLGWSLQWVSELRAKKD